LIHEAIVDRAYSAATHRAMLHKRRITIVIPQQSDQMAGNKRGRNRGQPPELDVEASEARKVVNAPSPGQAV
jgi:hypothetical protein